MKKCEILLIEPPPVGSMGNLRILGSTGMLKTNMCWPPLDLMIIAGALREKNIQSEIIDSAALNISALELKKIIKDKNPRLVVFSTSTSTIKNDLAFVSMCKTISKDIITAVFGIHIAALPEEVLNLCDDLDVAVYGEPETVIVSFAQSGFDLDSTKGICYRSKTDIIKNPESLICQNRDLLGFPAHDKIPLHKYHDPHTETKPLSMTLAQQGCINECMYCVCPKFYGKLNSRTPEHVVSELKWAEDLGIKEMRFFDSGLTSNILWAKTLFDLMIKEKLNIKWVSNIRADRFSLDLAVKMKEAGCRTVCIGCESADETILKNAKKNILPGQVAQAVNTAKKAGLNTQVYFMFGLPGETMASMKKTLKFAKKISPGIVTFNIANPQPGTDFYNFLENKKYFKTKDYSKFDPVKPPVFDYPELSSEKIFNFMIYSYRSFYMDYFYILRKLLKIRSFRQLNILVGNFKGFILRYVFKNI